MAKVNLDGIGQHICVGLLIEIADEAREQDHWQTRSLETC